LGKTMLLSSHIAAAQSLFFHPKTFHGQRRPAHLSSRFRASADIPDFLSPDWYFLILVEIISVCSFQVI